MYSTYYGVGYKDLRAILTQYTNLNINIDFDIALLLENVFSEQLAYV